jgi:YNFM family putative membrane transporter
MLWILVAITLAGLLLMAAGSVATVVMGLLVTTGGFFAAHSVASGWVSARSARLGVQGSAVYVCCYYLGSGVGGTIGGLAFSAGGWSAVTCYTGAFLLAVLTIAILLRKLRPAAPDGSYALMNTEASRSEDAGPDQRPVRIRSGTAKVETQF